MITVRAQLCVVLVLAVIGSVSSYGSYRDAIPNGQIVPHPCKANYVWKGVGHRLVEGGKSRNPFGLDFAASGHKWTEELCRKDSDGDGMTNGQELGDPDCVWSKDKNPTRSDKLSHPGVCEPWNDYKCKTQLDWVAATCEFEKFTCPGIEDDDVKQQEIRFPTTQVPTQETTYMCKEFNLDTSDDFHLIATEILINNSNVMHHAVVFGCALDEHELRSTPHQCGMIASEECKTILSIWTLGSAGQCFHNKIGFKIGTQGYKRIALQFHWNNPELIDDYVDSSGMILYYTNKKRENDAGVLTIGAQYLNIPPYTPSIEDTSICPGSCTKKFIKDKVYVVSALNHMHYLGRTQKIEVFRDGKKIIDISNDVEYNYDSPVVHDKDNPIELLPGDTLSTTCGYSSKNKDVVTYYGDATSDEMCFGFITYYPKQNMDNGFCVSWKTIPFCQVYGYKELNPYTGCDFGQFAGLNDDDKFKFSEIIPACGISIANCSTQCISLLDKLYQHPCMVEDDTRSYFRNSWVFSDQGNELVKLLDRCYSDNNGSYKMGITNVTLVILTIIAMVVQD